MNVALGVSALALTYFQEPIDDENRGISQYEKLLKSKNVIKNLNN